MTSFASTLDSPCGPLRVLVDDDGALTHLEVLDAIREPSIVERLEAEGVEVRDDPNRTSEIARELHEYFSGERTDFEVPVAPLGTPFQLAVWEQLRLIPYATTRSYGRVAKDLGRPGSSRAVGRAAGANPIPIVVPCHRVVGSDGSLVGFGGGLLMKAFLLTMERRYHPTYDGPQLHLDFE